MLDQAPSSVPVIAGADRPLTRDLVTAKETHGEEGLGDHPAPPALPVKPDGRALCDALERAGGPVVLVTLGPLTNLALALRADRALVEARVTRHVAMAGNIEAAGNTGPFSEFNMWCDPEAAAHVLAAGLGTALVGLDVTRQLVIPAPAVARLAHHADERARWLGRLLGFYVRFHEEAEGLRGAVINDPLAVALAVEPALGQALPYFVRMDLSEGPDRGRTHADSGPGTSAVHVYRSFDHGRMHALLVEHVFGPWLSPGDFVP